MSPRSVSLRVDLHQLMGLQKDPTTPLDKTDHLKTPPVMFFLAPNIHLCHSHNKRKQHFTSNRMKSSADSG